ETAMEQMTVDRNGFRKMFRARAVVVTQLPPGYGRELATRVNEASGRRDVSLRTTAEYLALFELLVKDADVVPPAEELALRYEHGQPTAAGRAIEDYVRASQGRDEFFDVDMYMVYVTGLRPPSRILVRPLTSAGNFRIELWRTDPEDHEHIPPPSGEGVLFSASNFSLGNCGNHTRRASKPSWRIDLQTPEGGANCLNGMAHIRLTAMYNDPSQMREALAWGLLSRVGVPSPRHTYAKLAFNTTYRGLFSVIEQIDKRFLKARFAKNHRGNLYKAGCGDVGCATLVYRTGLDGDDTGCQYFIPGADRHTYRLRTNKYNPKENTYDDLACLIRTINGIGLRDGPGRFDTDDYRDSMDRIMNTRAFLRWASVNILLGGWDNYFATPSNYYLYNSGREGSEKDFVASPYFTFIPWDYDNCLGIDYFGIRWQYANILDWPSNTIPYWKNRRTSQIPLVQNLLSNRDYMQYYLDHMEYVLDVMFSPKKIAAEIGQESDGGLWDRVRQAAYLESTTPDGRPFTGRRFSNHEVYLNGCRQYELRDGKAKIDGILHYVRMRHDSAWAQLKQLRRTIPRATESRNFPAVMERLPR
ncbi:MAG: CotH kinase family protein, partial [Arthrobacter sp.]